MKKLYIALSSVMLSLPVLAQTGNTSELKGEAEYRYNDLIGLWHNTDNATGLAIDSSENRGYAAFSYFHHGGSYHRVQEGGMANHLQFGTERYQKLGKHLYGYGRFDFDMGRTKDRAYADQYRIYNTSPFNSGSAIVGKYDNQDFRLTAAVGTVSFDGWRFGARLDYDFGDLSRLKDPRSEAKLLRYRITPAVSYSFGANTIGLTGYYDRRKEKMGPLSTVQNDATFTYYLYSGMENADGTQGGFSSFNREWVKHNFGFNLAYGYKGERFQTLNNFGMSRAHEDIYGTYKYEPGRYVQHDYLVSSQNRLRRGGLLHQLDVKAVWIQGYADEYRSQLNITSDPETGYSTYTYERLLTFKKRYQVRTTDLSLRYRANFLGETNGVADKVNGYAGFFVNYNRADNRHVLTPSESTYSRVDMQLENGISLFNNSLIADLQLGYSISTKTDLQLSDNSSILAQNVLLKDLDYYKANVFHGGLQVMYQFPLTIKKNRALFFIKGFGNVASANITGHPCSTNVGLSVGVFN